MTEFVTNLYLNMQNMTLFDNVHQKQIVYAFLIGCLHYTDSCALARDTD